MSDQSNQTGYTSVLYVHGMGSQRRYEEVSRLVDSLDMYAHSSEGKGILRKIAVRLEPGRGLKKGERDVTFLRVIHSRRSDETRTDAAVRFYESYWAPVTAGGSSYRSVLSWLGSQLLTPLQSLRSRWRERQRLRRSALHRLCDRCGDVDARDMRKLLKQYNEFEGWDARRRFPSGTFNDFEAYLKIKLEEKPDTTKRLLRLAQRWRRSYVISECTSQFVISSIILAVGLGFLTLLGVGLWVLNLFTPIVMDLAATAGLEHLNLPVTPSLRNGLTLAAILLYLIGVFRFLSDYLGDVQFWCTYEETDEKHAKRSEILRRTTEMLSHILEDPQCSRVVVVAHSLGTAIAHDALLDVARYNRAREVTNPMSGPIPLEKLSHFITMGSPIDKIQYFFEQAGGKSHRYNRVVEDLRGDIGTAPFSKNRHPYVHWINFWDTGDFVSSSLESPANKLLIQSRVDNVHINNGRFPGPSNHSGYFNNRSVIKIICECIFEGKHRYTSMTGTAAEMEGTPPMLGPGKFLVIPRLLRIFLIVLPWAILALAVGHIFELTFVTTAGLWTTILLLGLSILGFIISSVEGHLDPIPKTGRSAGHAAENLDDGTESEENT